MTAPPPARSPLPSAGNADRTLGLLRAGYPFLLRLRQSLGADAITIRLLGRRTTVVSGAEGARLFYDESMVRRRGAIPRLLRIPLFGSGAVHGLDGARHKHRKQLFVLLLTDDAAREVAALAAQRWRAAEMPQTPAAAFDAAVHMHTAAILDWCGLPAGTAAAGLAHDLVTMVDGFGSVGPRHVRAPAGAAAG